MAIVTTIVDDLTGEEAATRTVRASFDGHFFDLDLSEASYEKVRAMFADLMARGRSTTANAKIRQPDEWAEMNQPSVLPGVQAVNPKAEPKAAPEAGARSSQTELEIPRGASPAKPSHGFTSKDLDKATRQIMRRWAEESGWAKRNGVVVPTRGALGQNIIDAYLTVHPAQLKTAK